MSANRPRADIQDVGYHFIRVPLGYHSYDLLFPRTELDAGAPRPGHTDQQIAKTIYLGINQHFFGGAGIRFARGSVVVNQAQQLAQGIVQARLYGFFGRVDCDKGWAGTHDHFSNCQGRTGAIQLLTQKASCFLSCCGAPTAGSSAFLIKVPGTIFVTRSRAFGGKIRARPSSKPVTFSSVAQTG